MGILGTLGFAAEARSVEGVREAGRVQGEKLSWDVGSAGGEL